MKQIKIQVKKGEERLDEEYFSRRGCGETLPSRRIYWAPGCHMWVIVASRGLDEPDSSREIARTRFGREWQVLQVGWKERDKARESSAYLPSLFHPSRSCPSHSLARSPGSSPSSDVSDPISISHIHCPNLRTNPIDCPMRHIPGPHPPRKIV